MSDAGLSQLTVETEDGQWLRVPYSSVVNHSLSLQSPRKVVPGETMIELRVYKWDDPGKMEKDIKRVLAQSHGSLGQAYQYPVLPGRIALEFFFLLDPVYSQG